MTPHEALQARLKKQLRTLARRCVPTAGSSEIDQLVQILHGMVMKWLISERRKIEPPQNITRFIEVKSTKKQFTLKVIPDALFGPKSHKFVTQLMKDKSVQRSHLLKAKS